MKTFGVTFPTSSQWHKHQAKLMDRVENQITTEFPDKKNAQQPRASLRASTPATLA